jgi:hypothetical protein
MKRMRQPVVTGAGLALALLVALATPGSAHSGGRVQLFVDRLNLHSVAGNDWTVSVTLVDADSGTPAPGFDVVAEADPAAGTLTLSDQGAGHYSAPFTAAPGKRDIAIRAETQPGGTPGVPLRKVYSVVLEPGKDVAIGAGSGRSGLGLALPVAAVATAVILGWFLVSRRRRSAAVAVALVGIMLQGGARPAEATETPSDVRVRVERSDKVGQTPLWIPVRATVTDGDGGRPLPVDHLVFAAARNSRGDEAGPFSLGPLEANDPGAKGIHQGFVIVPYGGSWTITALAKTAHADPGVPSAVLGRGTAEMVVDAPVPPAGATAATAGTSGPDSEPLGAAVLWLHTMVAIAWGIVIALLALLALPAGRRYLSEHGGTVLDGHLDKIARAAWWTTGLVVATGIYNMVNSVAYRVPLSPDQVSRLFRLPYAQPYYLSLAVKLAAYAVMIGATIPLIREARRRATMDAAESVVALPDDPSPWENPKKPTGPVAVRTKEQVALEADWERPAPSGGPARVPVAIMVAGTAVIITAVTLLKYFHLLGELSRLSG